MANRLIGRKLYVKWGENMYVAIEKIPDGSKKNLELDLLNDKDPKEYVSMELCNVYENERGEKIEESLGSPCERNPGYTIDRLFTDSGFWKTPGEAMTLTED